MLSGDNLAARYGALATAAPNHAGLIWLKRMETMMATCAAFLGEIRDNGLDDGNFYVATSEAKHTGKIADIWPDAVILALEITIQGTIKQHLQYVPYAAIREIHALRDKPAST